MVTDMAKTIRLNDKTRAVIDFLRGFGPGILTRDQVEAYAGPEPVAALESLLVVETVRGTERRGRRARLRLAAWVRRELDQRGETITLKAGDCLHPPASVAERLASKSSALDMARRRHAGLSGREEKKAAKQDRVSKVEGLDSEKTTKVVD